VSSPSGVWSGAQAENGFYCNLISAEYKSPLLTAGDSNFFTFRPEKWWFIYTSLFTINGRKQVIILVIIITVKQLYTVPLSPKSGVP